MATFEDAAEALMRFIKDHVRIVGWEEIDAYHKARSVYDSAVEQSNEEVAWDIPRHSATQFFTDDEKELFWQNMADNLYTAIKSDMRDNGITDYCDCNLCGVLQEYEQARDNE